MMTRWISRPLPAIFALSAFTLSGCEVFFLMGDEDFEKHPEVRRTSELFMDETELRESRAKRAHGKALLAANPRWPDYLEAAEAKDWTQAAALALTFDLKPLNDRELGGVLYALEQAGAPAEQQARIIDTRRALELRWEAWPAFMAAYRAGAWAQAADAAQTFSEINAIERVKAAEWGLIAKVARKSDRPQLAGLRDRAEAFAASAKRSRDAKDAAAYAEYQARIDEMNARRKPVDLNPGRAFDFQGTLAKRDESPATARCPRCLGSGKDNYVNEQKVEELDVNRKGTGRLVDPACTECGGSGVKPAR